MKSLFKTLALALMLANGISCQQMPDDSLDGVRMVSLSITARTFDSYEIGQWEEGGGNDFTLGGKESRSGEETVKRIAFAILDKNGDQILLQEKDKSESGYASLNADVPADVYQLIAFAHNGDGNISINKDGVISPPGDKLTDSFLYYSELDLTNDFEEENTITLNRCVSKFSLKHTDILPHNVSVVEISFSKGGNTLQASNGFSSESESHTVTINLPSSAGGTSENTFSGFTFLPSKSCVMDITVTAKNSKGNIVTKQTFKDVEMEQNIQTIYSGAFFSKETEFTATINSNWGANKEVNF